MRFHHAVACALMMLSVAAGCGDDEGGAGGAGAAGAGGSGGQGGTGGQGGEAPLELETLRGDVPYDQAPEASAEELAALRASSLDVATFLVRQQAASAPNAVVSPHSLNQAFGQLYGGSRGELHASIAAALGFTIGDRVHEALNAQQRALEARRQPGADDEPRLEVSRANGLFTDEALAAQVEAPFLDLLSQHYDAGIGLVPIQDDLDQAVALVNRWVSDRTNQRIQDLIPPQEPPVTMFVVNALYFAASWEDDFSPEVTDEATFTRASGAEISVDMMHGGARDGRWAEHEGWSAATLPYLDPSLEMVILLPDEDRRAELEASLDAEILGGVLDALEPSRIDLSLPKFTLSTGTVSLKEPLMSRGLLSSGELAFPGSSIADVYHQVFVAVDEEGTEAAAATAVVVNVSGAGGLDAQHELVVDRTFYFVIHDASTGTILFVGRVDDPNG
jgi:serpin B